jgi:hypothetical protein
MATDKASRLSISTRHLIIEYSKKDLSAVHILRLLHRKHNVTTTRQSIFKHESLSNFLENLLLSRHVAGARTPVLLYRFTSLKIDCLVVVTLCLRCSSLRICTADKSFFEYSIIPATWRDNNRFSRKLDRLS